MLITAAGVALALPGVAQAQVRGGEQMGPGRGGVFPLPQDIRPIGFQQHRYASGFEYTAHFEADQCEKLGCMIVVNRSKTFEVTEFYINDGDIDARGVPVWGRNQFKGFHLDPSRAVWTVRPRSMKCMTLVRVVLRERGTDREVEAIQPFDMCDKPRDGFAMIQVQADGPRVTLENGTTID
ncbi:hypothetical protein OF829_16410 [Sphingomonas sp. LB-2]|uniref:hypothetical protein n=1 Tax=Sphingomonas caeni TaxID=2984949 RepID=UPI00222F30C4|nr:hypothetical protein [Sphingomonas caeni]MCW3848822.1 hypothetical protein [Sphingomonas caeni]